MDELEASKKAFLDGVLDGINKRAPQLDSKELERQLQVWEEMVRGVRSVPWVGEITPGSEDITFIDPFEMEVFRESQGAVKH